VLDKINKAVVDTNIAQYRFQVSKCQCFGFCLFVITHFNNIVTNLRD